MAEVLGIKDQFISFTVAIDKLDKVGPQGVLDEMSNQGISSEAVARFGQWLEAGMTLERSRKSWRNLKKVSSDWKNWNLF
jgi:hypothetical protein